MKSKRYREIILCDNEMVSVYFSGYDMNYKRNEFKHIFELFEIIQQ